jgi:hypothetical protein
MTHVTTFPQRAIADSLVREWREEAKRRRGMFKSDPVPDVLEYCAGELAARAHAVEAITEMTVEEFADLHLVTAQTVRTWCRRGRIGARQTPKGWAIPQDALPPKSRRGA